MGVFFEIKKLTPPILPTPSPQKCGQPLNTKKISVHLQIKIIQH